MNSETPGHWRDLLQPKGAWFVGAGCALVSVLVANSLLPNLPDWLAWSWAGLLLVTGFLIDWVRANRTRKYISIAIYILAVALSAYLVFDPFSQRKPLVVQEVTALGEFSPNPQTDFRAHLEGEPFAQYASGIFIITNTTGQRITFQALLKIEDDQPEHILAAALAYGDVQGGWSKQVRGFFDALFRSEQDYLLSPVTIEPHATIRGRFAFRIPVLVGPEEFKDKIALWISAIDPVKPLKGRSYIDLRDFSNGARLAEPMFLLGKDKPH